MADDKFNLTDLDREKLKSSSTYSLPDNPSDKHFSAAQIKKAMYQPSLMLFDWMKEGFDDIEDKEEEFDEKLADKVDKLKTANKIYGTDANGDDTGISFSIDPIANTFPKRDNNGDILVSETPQNDKSAVSRSHLTTKLTELYNTIDNEKISKPTIPVTIEHAIVQTASGFGVMQINSNPYANTIVRRSLTGTVKTANGVANNDAASFGQLQTEINRATSAENDIMAVASGKCKSITISIVDNPDFDSNNKIITYIGTIKDVAGKIWNISDLQKGDNIYVVELDKKDRWYIGSNQFSILEADTSFLVNYQKKLIPNADNGILLDASGNIQANVSFALLKGSWMDNLSLDTEINKKQNKTTSYNFNTDSTKTVFYQTTAPVHAPHGALWMSQAAGVQVSFDKILGSIKDNAISDTYIKNLLKDKTDRNVLSTIEAIYSGDDVKIKTLQVNLWTQNAQYNTFNLNLANATTAGLMSYEDYNTLIANTQKLAQLEGRMKRISYELKDHPTESDIDAYVRGLGYQEVDFPYLKVVVYATKHMWLYYSIPAKWQDDGIDSASIFTNATAGLIKGSATAGKVFAESDGTGSVFGWDALNTKVDNNESSIASIQADLPNYMPKSGGTFTGNVNMQGHIINMLGGYVKNVKEGSVDDAVPKKWITAQLANYLPISGGNITGDLSITGTLTVNTFELSNNLNAKTNKIINLGNPTNATDAANKDYVDLGDDNLSDLISTEVNARIEADNTIMLTKTVDPSTASVGQLGQLWKNTTNGKVFKCNSIVGSIYNWSELGSGATNIVTTDTEQTITGHKIFQNSSGIKLLSNSNYYSTIGPLGISYDDTLGNVKYFGWPSVSGDLVVRSEIPDITNCVLVDSTQTITGYKTFAEGINTYHNQYSAEYGFLSIKKKVDSTVYTLTLPEKTGTLALTSDVDNKLIKPSSATGGALQPIYFNGSGLVAGTQMYDKTMEVAGYNYHYLSTSNITGPKIYSKNLTINGGGSAIFSPNTSAITGFYAPTASGTSGQVLKSNGDGVAPSFVDIGTLLQSFYDGLHPVGDIQFGFQAPGVPAGVTATWTDISSAHAGRYFRISASQNVGTFEAEALPNITGQFNFTTGTSAGRHNQLHSEDLSGCFSAIGVSDWTSNIGVESAQAACGISFNAHDSNNIYQDGAGVKPLTETIKIWQRTA